MKKFRVLGIAALIAATCVYAGAARACDTEIQHAVKQAGDTYSAQRSMHLWAHAAVHAELDQARGKYEKGVERIADQFAVYHAELQRAQDLLVADNLTREAREQTVQYISDVMDAMYALPADQAIILAEYEVTRGNLMDEIAENQSALKAARDDYRSTMRAHIDACRNNGVTPGKK